MASGGLSWSSSGAKPLLPVGAETGVVALTSRLVPVSTRAFTCKLKREDWLLLGELRPKFFSLLHWSGRLGHIITKKEMRDRHLIRAQMSIFIIYFTFHDKTQAEDASPDSDIAA